MPLRLELLLLPSLAEAVECSGDAGEEAWEVWAWEEWVWEDQAWQERVWEEWAWEVVWEEEVEEEVSGTGSGREELQVPGLVQPSRR